MPNKITTGQMFEQWELMNQKLDALDQKIDGIIDGSTPANTQLTGSNVEERYQDITVPANGYYRFGVKEVAFGSKIGINITTAEASSFRITSRPSRGQDSTYAGGENTIVLEKTNDTYGTGIYTVTSRFTLVFIFNTGDKDMTVMNALITSIN